MMRHAGMSGVVVGLDFSQALAALPPGLDPRLVRELLIEAEAALLGAMKEDGSDGE
jgi:hypothetical protein